MIKKIAVLTSGGDAPGMNNAVRAVVKESRAHGIEPYLVFEGYKGLYEGNIKKASSYDVEQYNSKGGTFIYSARFPQFKDAKLREIAKDNLKNLGIDALIVIGGDGSYRGAQLLHEMGIKTMALPGTIDNDITSSIFTIGYDTALNTIVDSVDKIRDTANSHSRVIVVEVMGRDCGDLALYSAIATGAEVLITNESQMSPDEIIEKVKEQRSLGKRAIIVLTSEHVFKDVNQLASMIENKTGITARAVILAHTQRGGTPTAMERIRASILGMEAVKRLLKNQSGLALGIGENKIIATPILEALELKRENRVSLANEINKFNQS